MSDDNIIISHCRCCKIHTPHRYRYSKKDTVNGTIHHYFTCKKCENETVIRVIRKRWIIRKPHDLTGGLPKDTVI